jgi:hypothetical protein
MEVKIMSKIAERITKFITRETGIAFKMGQIKAYRDVGYSYATIAQKMNIAESSVRALDRKINEMEINK